MYGKMLRLTERILGLTLVDGKRIATIIPANVTVELAATGHDNTTDILWDAKEFTVFTQDLEARSEALRVPPGV